MEVENCEKENSLKSHVNSFKHNRKASKDTGKIEQDEAGESLLTQGPFQNNLVMD